MPAWVVGVAFTDGAVVACKVTEPEAVGVGASATVSALSPHAKVNINPSPATNFRTGREATAAASAGLA